MEDSTMIYFEFAVLFGVWAIGLANPMEGDVSAGPQRCCLPGCCFVILSENHLII